MSSCSKIFTLSEKGVNILIQSVLFLSFFWVRAMGCKILFWYIDWKKRILCKHHLFSLILERNLKIFPLLLQQANDYTSQPDISRQV